MAQCAKSLSSEKCEQALNDSDAARDNAKTAAEGLKGVAGRMKDGKLTDADNAALKVVEQRFGKNFTSEKGLGKLAKGLEGAANKIGARGEGVVLRQGSTSTTTTQTAFVIPFTNSIYLNNYYFDGGFSNRYRERTMLHEAAHVNRKFGDDYIRNGVNDRHGQDSAFGNADTYACAAYPDACGF